MDFISTVFGIFSWAVANTDLRLTLDLNSVFIRVDFPRPLCPVSNNTLRLHRPSALNIESGNHFATNQKQWHMKDAQWHSLGWGSDRLQVLVCINTPKMVVTFLSATQTHHQYFCQDLTKKKNQELCNWPVQRSSALQPGWEVKHPNDKTVDDQVKMSPP